MRIVSPDRRSAFGFAPASNSVRTTDGLPFDWFGPTPHVIPTRDSKAFNRPLLVSQDLRMIERRSTHRGPIERVVGFVHPPQLWER